MFEISENGPLIREVIKKFIFSKFMLHLSSFQGHFEALTALVDGDPTATLPYAIAPLLDLGLVANAPARAQTRPVLAWADRL